MSRRKKLNFKNLIIADGAMGTMLFSLSNRNVCSAEMNLVEPQLVKKVHRLYAQAGAGFITSNTFSASAIRLKEFRLEKKFQKINRQAVALARQIADEFKLMVAGNIGPSGELLEPAGKLSFAQIVKNFEQQARLLERCGVDFFLLETFTDLLELKAALIAVSRVSDLPILASCSFTFEDRLANGTSAAVISATLDFPAVEALGANCGTTLNNMRQVISDFQQTSPKKIICQPNAEVAGAESGKQLYSPEELADFFEEIYPQGIAVIGSCCGSTPDHTAALARKFRNRQATSQKVSSGLYLTSERRTMIIRPERLCLIGERINPAGRKKMQQELLRGSLFIVRKEAVEQEKAGAEVLDVNLNIPELKLETVKKTCWSLQNLTDLPLAIDSKDPEIISTFLQCYRGKALINSVSGEEKSLQKILPLAKKFNLPFVASLLDRRGIPDKAERRVQIARKIVRKALKAGISLRQIIFDPLVGNLASEPQTVKTTLETIRLLKKHFPHNSIIIGLSNVSFGLPNRDLLNSAFMAQAIAAGANLIIANPLSEQLRNYFLTLKLLQCPDRKNLDSFLTIQSPAVEQKEESRQTPDFYESILSGDVYNATNIISRMLETKPALEIIKAEIVPAMNLIGEKYQNRELFLPHLISAAETVKAVFPLLKSRLPHQELKSRLKIMLATVEGDIHDIGKNLVLAVLEGFNLQVIDAGKDVPAEKILQLAKKEEVSVVGLSSLMTTTLAALEKTVQLLQRELPQVTIFVGGAVISEAFASRLKVNYAADGMAMIQKMRLLRLIE